jgi:hypothetical protein
MTSKFVPGFIVPNEALIEDPILADTSDRVKKKALKGATSQEEPSN